MELSEWKILDEPIFDPCNIIPRMTTPTGAMNPTVDVLYALPGNYGSLAGTSQTDSQTKHPLGITGSRLIGIAQSGNIRIFPTSFNPVPMPMSGCLHWNKRDNRWEPTTIEIRGPRLLFPLNTLSVLAHEIGHAATWETRFDPLFTCGYSARYNVDRFFSLLKESEINAWKWAKEFLTKENVWCEELEKDALKALKSHQIYLERI